MTTWLKRMWGSRASRPLAARRSGRRLAVEQLEDRTAPASFTAATVPELIADIEQANTLASSSRRPVENTITLAPGTTFTLTASYPNSWLSGFPFGDSRGLPIIAANNYLTIIGNGDTIERSTASSTPWFGIFGEAAGASLSLSNLTLQGGRTIWGGAIFNQGSLTLQSVTLQNNIASGSVTIGGAIGGAIYSIGSLTMQDCTVQNNQALGYSYSNYYPGSPGGTAAGGGIYVGGGTASLTNVTLSANTALGGDGSKGGWVPAWGGGQTYVPAGAGGNGLGGGIYAAGATVSLHNCTLRVNRAIGGTAPQGAAKGIGIGGGLYIGDPSVTLVCLDAFTIAHALKNTADVDPNIHGSYTTCS